MQILIVGGSKGLGRFLATNLQGTEIYAISRSKLVEGGVASVCIDVDPGKKPDYTHVVIQEITEEDCAVAGMLNDDWK